MARNFLRQEACSGHGKKRARRVMTRTRRKRGLHLPKGVMQGARPRGGKKACSAQMRRKRGAVGERAESFSCARDTFGARQEAHLVRYDVNAEEAGASSPKGPSCKEYVRAAARKNARRSRGGNEALLSKERTGFPRRGMFGAWQEARPVCCDAEAEEEGASSPKGPSMQGTCPRGGKKDRPAQPWGK